MNLVGICMIMYAKESIKHKINNITGMIVRSGFIGLFGNKGNVIIRFEINNYSFIVSCCHLTSDLSKNDSRLKELNEIIEKTIHVNSFREMKFKDHDIQIIFGDLNFRIQLENSTCRQMIKSGKLESLVAYDQFNISKTTNRCLFYLEEGDLFFNPTYKYDFNSDEYDTSNKKRVPSWCDRIFWKKNDILKLLTYNAANYKFSDHRPIYGIFIISTNGKSMKGLDKDYIRINSKNLNNSRNQI